MPDTIEVPPGARKLIEAHRKLRRARDEVAEAAQTGRIPLEDVLGPIEARIDKISYQVGRLILARSPF